MFCLVKFYYCIICMYPLPPPLPSLIERRKEHYIIISNSWDSTYGIPGTNMAATLQRQNTEISKQIFPEKEYWGLSSNFHIHASVSDLYIPTIGLTILLEEICRPILGLYKSLTDT